MRHIKPLTLLLIVNIALLLAYLQGPYFILFGLFFFDSLPASLLVVSLVILYFVITVKIIRKNKRLSKLLRFLSIFLIINASVNLMTAFFVAEDLAGYFVRQFSSDIFYGFLVMHAALIIVNGMVLFRLNKSKVL